MNKKLPDHIDGLIRYLSSPEEKANEDLILKYFRKTFGEEFTRQKEAGGSDGYLPGHFVLELKGKTNDWLAGLFQGIAYRKNLDFGVIVVAAKGFLAIWSIDDLDEAFSEAGNLVEPDDVDTRQALAEPCLIEYVGHPVAEIVGRFG